MEPKPLPTIRANRNDINRVFGLFAALEELSQAESEFAARLKVIPNGRRDIRMIRSVLDKLLVNILSTMPEEKIMSVKRMAPHMQYKLYSGIRASQVEDSECVIPTKNVDVLTRYAHEHCKLCVDMDCGRCDLGKTFDKTLTIDRDGGNWAFIDFDDIYEKG